MKVIIMRWICIFKVACIFAGMYVRENILWNIQTIYRIFMCTLSVTDICTLKRMLKIDKMVIGNIIILEKYQSRRVDF